MWAQGFQAFLGETIGGETVAQDADEMTAGGLFDSKISNVAEQPADGRAHAMQDAQGFSHFNDR